MRGIIGKHHSGKIAPVSTCRCYQRGGPPDFWIKFLHVLLINKCDTVSKETSTIDQLLVIENFWLFRKKVENEREG